MEEQLISTLKIFRNDIDRVGVRDDCNLTMWSGDDFYRGGWALDRQTGESMGNMRHINNALCRWLVLAENPEYEKLHENIKSLHCSYSSALNSKLLSEDHRREGHIYTDI